MTYNDKDYNNNDYNSNEYNNNAPAITMTTMTKQMTYNESDESEFAG